MAFVVEDGTGKADANSYASVEYANAYFTDRGITTWVGTDAAKQGYLIRATDYMDMRFRSRYVGDPEFPDVQALGWPRTPAGMPDNLLKACCEYALRAIAGPLAPDLQVDPSGYALTSRKEKVGPIEESVTLAGSRGGAMRWRSYPEADGLMRCLLRPYPGNRVIRN